ncbi:hypothetical protein K0M31_015928 [Melipona bicolor]|uniref:Uncharacterized protein n=1 Tax=Melipona bicolor TaxID=60889 RepID=A0AA40G6G0_9HYME|nr:hypothetical protein K0M31_015928 [Melipona bicolor]
MTVLVESTQRRCSGEVFDHPHGSGTMKRSFYPASDDIVSVKYDSVAKFGKNLYPRSFYGALIESNVESATKKPPLHTGCPSSHTYNREKSDSI